MKVKWYGTGVTGAIKSRGMEYYRHSQVHLKSAEVTEEARYRFTAEVDGTQTYRVVAEVEELGDVTSLSCTCPYAASGNRCKHMAALLYHVSYWNVPKDLYREMLSQRYKAAAIRQRKEEEARRAAEEERERKEREFFLVRKPIHPFDRPASAPYRYFDFSIITASYVIYDKDFEEAQRLIQNLRYPSQFKYGYSR